MNRKLTYKLRTGQAKLSIIERKPVKNIPKDAELINGEYYVIVDDIHCHICDLFNVCTSVSCKCEGMQGYKKVIN